MAKRGVCEAFENLEAVDPLDEVTTLAVGGCLETLANLQVGHAGLAGRCAGWGFREGWGRVWWMERGKKCVEVNRRVKETAGEVWR